MKTFRTTGTGSEQTISEIESDKIPLYPTEQDLLDDLANLEVGQIAGTIDPAESELIGVLIQKIQALESKLKNNDVMSDYETITLSTSSVTPTEMQYDGEILICTGYNGAVTMYINNIELPQIIYGTTQSNQAVSRCVSIAVNKGDKIYYTVPFGSNPAFYGRFYKVRDYSSR